MPSTLVGVKRLRAAGSPSLSLLLLPQPPPPTAHVSQAVVALVVLLRVLVLPLLQGQGGEAAILNGAPGSMTALGPTAGCGRLLECDRVGQKACTCLSGPESCQRLVGWPQVCPAACGCEPEMDEGRADFL